MNFSIHYSAKEQIDNILTQAQKQEKAFRIYIRRISGWRGPVWDIALDEPTHKDEVFESEGIQNIYEKRNGTKN